jgi:hypothetical protein
MVVNVLPPNLLFVLAVVKGVESTDEGWRHAGRTRDGVGRADGEAGGNGAGGGSRSPWWVCVAAFTAVYKDGQGALLRVDLD